MITVYFGPDSGLLSVTAESDLEKTLSENELRAVVKYDGYKDPVADFVSDASSLSLFGEKKVLLFADAYFLTDSTRKEKGGIKESDQDYDGLLSYLKDPDPNTDLLFLVPGNLNAKNAIVKALKDAGASFYDCENPSLEDYVALALKSAKKEKKAIDRDAAVLLYQFTEGDYLLFVHSLDKLLTYTDHVMAADVRTLVYQPLETNVFEIVSDLLERKESRSILIYRDLRKAGNDPLAILPVLVSQFRFMALAKYLIEKGESDDEIARELSGKGTTVNPKRLYYTRKDTKYLTFKVLLRILAELFDIEEGIKKKSDSGDERIELFLALFGKKYLR
jgi:DNA polymerase-3 subunit delta